MVVWGIIGFKVIKALSKKPENPLVQPQVSIMPKTVKKRDVFSLKANYRDPFLGTLPAPKKKPAKKRVIKKEPVPKRIISYSGLVSQAASDKTMFFISINGKQHIMSKNEAINGVTLLKGNGQQITVRYNGVTETISLQ